MHRFAQAHRKTSILPRASQLRLSFFGFIFRHSSEVQKSSDGRCFVGAKVRLGFHPNLAGLRDTDFCSFSTELNDIHRWLACPRTVKRNRRKIVANQHRYPGAGRPFDARWIRVTTVTDPKLILPPCIQSRQDAHPLFPKFRHLRQYSRQVVSDLPHPLVKFHRRNGQDSSRGTRGRSDSQREVVANHHQYQPKDFRDITHFRAQHLGVRTDEPAFSRLIAEISR
jgi:hypothetical protein